MTAQDATEQDKLKLKTNSEGIPGSDFSLRM